jgi:hypothetical protein
MSKETQGKPSEGNDNKQQIQTQDNKLLSPKADVLDQARLRPLREGLGLFDLFPFS